MREDLASTYRKIMSINQKTNFSVGGGKTSRGTPVYANNYVFTTSDGKEFNGVSYATGQQLQAGTVVKIEYRQDNPSISRIQGMRRKILGAFGLIAVIFPIVGFFLFFPG